jgi:hypothetical protein
MKKLIKKTFVILIVAILSAFILPELTAFAWIGEKYINEDEAFFTIMEEMKEDHGFNYDDFTYVKAPLYNTDLEISGYVYDFNLDGLRDGFVLMVKTYDDCYEVTEVFVDAKSKFYDSEGVNIYPQLLTYINYMNGIFYDLTTLEEISLEEVISLEVNGFKYQEDELIGTPANETVYYYIRYVSTTQIYTKIPKYIDSPSLEIMAAHVPPVL